MEFIEEDTRPRFVFQSRSSNLSSPLKETLEISKLHLTICLSFATFLLIAAFSLISNTSFLFYLLIWISLSLLLAPFAPPSLTGGDPTVGKGDPLPLPPPLLNPLEPEEPRRRPNSRFTPKPNAPSFSPAGVVNPRPDVKRGVDPGPEDRRVDAGNVDFSVSGWSKEEDIALLNALKVFPKDVAMRWEKVATAVEGKSKAECMKRVSELKRDFRSFKSSEK